jgi:predicted O-methyltransferase YrrM
LRNFIEKKRVIEWKRNGKPVPPPHSIKQQVIRNYAKDYGIKILVETGTLHGDMLEAMRKDFERLYSIELDEKLYKDAQKRFNGVNHIELIHGDSGVQLEFLLKKTEPALFWLDGHYSGGITAKGEKTVLSTKNCIIY